MTESHKVAVKVLEALKAQDISQLRNLFFTPISFLLTNYRVGCLLDLANFLLGPLESWTSPETLATFQRGEQALTLSIWGNKATGVGVVNAIDLGLIPPWKAPSYVDESAFIEQEVLVRPYWLWPGTKGTLNLPKASPETRKPAVLFVPGSGPMDRDATLGGTKCFKDLAYGLATAGYITLRMDKPMAVVAFKQVVTKSITVEDEYITPLCAALKYLAAHPAVDPEKIFLLGGSLGGTVAPRLCRDSPVPIKAMISCAGASLPMDKAMLAQLKYLNEHFPRPDQAVHEKEVALFEEVQRCIETGGLRRGEKDPTKDLPFPLPLSYLTDLCANDPVEMAKRLDQPIMFIHGMRDWQVGMDHYTRWQTGLEESLVGMEWRLHDDVGHLMTVVDEKKYGAFQYAEPANVKEGWSGILSTF